MTATLVEEKPTFTTWKTVVVGTLHNADTARATCEQNGITPSWGWQILDRMRFETVPATLALVCVTPLELGVSGERVTLPDVYTAAKRQGLVLCPPEVGPQLWLQHRDDIKAYDPGSHPFLIIGMEPIVIDDEYGFERVFSLQASFGTRWLDALAPDNIGRQWPDNARLVFVHAGAV